MAKTEQTLIDIIAAIEQQLPKPPYRTDEVLDELLEASDRLLIGSPSDPTATARGPLYYWGPHSPATEEIKWTFFKWG